jgi:hypothetical protein
MSYDDFLERKSQLGGMCGFDPLWMPAFLFDFQAALVEWALLKGRAAIFSDCGTGKSAMQLVWAENVIQKTNGRVLILTPLAVSHRGGRITRRQAPPRHHHHELRTPAPLQPGRLYRRGLRRIERHQIL